MLCSIMTGLTVSFQSFSILNPILEAGKPKRERDEIVVGKWVAENHATYAKTKNVVKRANDDKSAKKTVILLLKVLV